MDDKLESPEIPPTLPTLDEDKAIHHERERLGNGHKRTLSGSLFSKLPFLRMTQGTPEGSDKSPTSIDIADGETVSPTQGGAMAAAIQQQKKTRKRKGSLRKTALLGTNVLRLEGREKKSLAALGKDVVLPNGSEKDEEPSDARFLASPTSPDNDSTPRPSYELQRRITPPRWSHPNAQLPSIQPGLRHDEDQSSVSSVTSPTLGDASTTDEDDIVTFPRLPTSVSIPPIPPAKSPSSSSDSYFPLQTETVSRHRRQSHRTKSPLATHAVEITATPEDWDYSETEWWGWIILIVTWIVFVIGMGSCLGVWSWAWDVGETPYAPPELEDDPTLPIVGYYPALIILTAVMAWVWVVVAWVGMKYFKHANISGEDV